MFAPAYVGRKRWAKPFDSVSFEALRAAPFEQPTGRRQVERGDALLGSILVTKSKGGIIASHPLSPTEIRLVPEEAGFLRATDLSTANPIFPLPGFAT